MYGQSCRVVGRGGVGEDEQRSIMSNKVNAIEKATTNVPTLHRVM